MNLRHLRAFLAVRAEGSITGAAQACNVSQPAVSQALNRLEAETGARLLHAGRDRAELTEAGRLFGRRVERALDRLDQALDAVAPRLVLTVTRPQLSALIALSDAENFTLAARRLGVSQPTVHRTIGLLEAEAGRALFVRSGKRTVVSRPGRALADAARLSLRDLDQALDELAEFSGREAGRIAIGAMPLSRSGLLPQALAQFRAERPGMPVSVVDGPYDDLLTGLLRGEIDVLVGALRVPTPVPEIRQDPLFSDDLVMVARAGHPLDGVRAPSHADLLRYPWVAPRPGTPARTQFDRFFSAAPAPMPALVECSSLILMRELLRRTDHIGCISRMQASAEIDLGALVSLDVTLEGSARDIGLTTRADWLPTPAQARIVAILRTVATGH